MAIDPLGTGLRGRIKSHTVASGDGPAPARTGARRTPTVTHDRVEISVVAHTLQQSGVRAGEPADSQLTERMIAIGKRIAQNYYDRPEVQRVIIEKLKGGS